MREWRGGGGGCYYLSRDVLFLRMLPGTLILEGQVDNYVFKIPAVLLV
jgi:hypothetical protein